MKRLSGLWQSVLEGLLVAGIGLGIPTIATTLLWGFHYELAIEWPAFWFVAVLIWLTGHGVPIGLQLDDHWLEVLNLTADQSSFEVSLPLLGFIVLTVYLARNAGRRIAHYSLPWLSASVALAVFIGITVGAILTIPSDLAELSLPTAMLYPSLWCAIPLLLSMWFERPELLGGAQKLVTERIPQDVRLMIRDISTGAVMSVLIVLGLSGLVVGGLVFWNGLDIVSMYEALHTGILGGSILTLAQLLLIPNLLIWTLGWFAGPGFSIGIATQVSPLGTQLGPLPALPIFGAIPADIGGFGFLGFLVPILAGFLTALALKQRYRSLVMQLAVTAGFALLAAILAGLLGALSSGSIGPGRMLEVGVDAVQVGLWFGILVLIGAGAGTLSREISRTFLVKQ